MKFKNKFLIFSIIAILILLILTICINKSKTIQTNSNIISTKKIEWGIKRNDNHEQPDVGEINKKILEKNNGICLGNKNKKYIYLTFDEGYEAGYTPKLLETLKNNNVTATFFITAHFLNTFPDLVKQMIDEGHIVRKSYSKS